MNGEMTITTLDWIITVGLVSGLLMVGFITRRYAKGVSDFTVAGRKLRMWLGLSAASADGIAIVSIVNASEQAFTKGFSYAWLMLIGMMVGVPIIGLLGFGLKRYRATKVQSLPQFYEIRYSKGVENICRYRHFYGRRLEHGGIPQNRGGLPVPFPGLPAISYYWRI